LKKTVAEWVTAKGQSLIRIGARAPFDQDFSRLPGEDIFLRIGSPQLSHCDSKNSRDGGDLKKSRASPLRKSGRGKSQTRGAPSSSSNF